MEELKQILVEFAKVDAADPETNPEWLKALVDIIVLLDQQIWDQRFNEVNLRLLEAQHQQQTAGPRVLR